MQAGMKHESALRLSFTAGIIVYVLGTLMLCYCPWMFAIAAVAFGITAATAERLLWRWAAVIAIGLSVAMAIGEATKKERNNPKPVN